MSSHKVIVIGESSVGKNEILWKIKADKTNGPVDYTPKTYDVDGTPVCLHIYDTVVDERTFKISPSYFQGVRAAVVMYDITDKKTFDNLTCWFKSIKQFAEENGAISAEVSATKKGDTDRIFRELAVNLLHTL
ncbi:uncharacterized protein LOC136032678 isoform X2 [Artemia franciscana]|uniref:uncharacterized protein LOC136032678 isoform X2 n=1 Tax=Artemia franciscana TaxID=6661 RepID=UPI0032DA1911